MSFNSCSLMNEQQLNFYSKLKKIASKHNYDVLAKINVKDIVKPSDDAETIEKYMFEQIKEETIDFVLYNAEQNCITDLIQLKSTKNDKKTELVERICMDAGYHIIYQNCPDIEASIEWNKRFFG